MTRRPGRDAGARRQGGCRGRGDTGRHRSPSAPFVVLGVSAGIAAYKAVEVCRRLVDAGVHVAPVLTERATRFVGRATFDALGSEPTQTSRVGRGVAHPAHPARPAGRPGGGGPGHRRPAGPLRRRPGRRPADHHPGGHRRPGGGLPGHAHRDVGAPRRPGQPGHACAARGVIGGPARGRAPGRRRRRFGPDGRAGHHRRTAVLDRCSGRAPGPPRTPRDLAGVRVLVSAGGTREPIDPVRFITNRSSGKQGHALAAAGPPPGRRRRAGDHAPPAPSAPGSRWSRWRRPPRWRTPCSPGPPVPTWS